MSDDPPTRDEHVPTRRRPSRSVPQIIDLKADTQKGPRQAEASSNPKRESSSMPPRIAPTLVGPLVIGALAGAIAGMFATFLLMSLPTKSKDDFAQRLASVESAQPLYATSDRMQILEQQNKALEKKIITLEESTTKYAQKFSELDKANQALSDLLASAQKTLPSASDSSSLEALNVLAARVDTLAANIELLKSNTTPQKPDEMVRLSNGLALALIIKDRILNHQSPDREITALNALKIGGIEIAPIQNTPPKAIEPKQASTSPLLYQSAASWDEKLLSLFSKIVTISPIENSSPPKTDATDYTALRDIDRVIDLLSERIKAESTKP
jgi:hypothetical protein